MSELHQLIGRVFARRGYTVAHDETVNGVTFPLVATLGADRVLVDWKTDGPITAEEVRAFAKASRIAGGREHVLLALKGHGETTVRAAAEEGVDFWTASRAALEIGAAALAHACAVPGATPEPAPAVERAPEPEARAEPVEVPAPQASASTPRKFQSLVATAASLTNPSGDVYLYKNPRARVVKDNGAKPLGYAWGASTAASVAPTHASVAEFVPSQPRRVPVEDKIRSGNPAAPGHEDVQLTVKENPSQEAQAPAPMEEAAAPEPAPAPRVLREPPVVDPDPSWTHEAPPQTLAVKLDRERAIEVAGAKTGHNVHAKLKLVPCLTFEFDARVAAPELPEVLEGKGAVLVDALTGKLREVPPIAFTPKLPAKVEAPQPRIEPVTVYQRVKSHLMGKFSRDVKVHREVQGVEVFETKRVGPGADDLGFHHRGLTYAPVWTVHGDMGTVEIDATTGEILTEKKDGESDSELL